MRLIRNLLVNGALIAGIGAAGYYLVDDATKNKMKRAAATGLRIAGETAHAVADILEDQVDESEMSAADKTAAQWEKVGA